MSGRISCDSPACTNPQLEWNTKILRLFPVREQFCGELLSDCFSGLFIEHESFDLGMICLGVPRSPLRYCYAWNGGVISSSFAHSIIVECLLNVLDGFSLSVRNLFRKIWCNICARNVRSSCMKTKILRVSTTRLFSRRNRWKITRPTVVSISTHA